MHGITDTRRDLPGNADFDLSDWDPSQTGDWAADNATGRRYAAAMFTLMTVTQNPMPFVRLMRVMIDKGTAGGVEVGFLHAVAEKLICCLPLYLIS